jgi:hypothetical protein
MPVSLAVLYLFSRSRVLRKAEKRRSAAVSLHGLRSEGLPVSIGSRDALVAPPEPARPPCVRAICNRLIPGRVGAGSSRTLAQLGIRALAGTAGVLAVIADVAVFSLWKARRRKGRAQSGGVRP